jgi:hypothetical protein
MKRNISLTVIILALLCSTSGATERNVLCECYTNVA